MLVDMMCGKTMDWIPNRHEFDTLGTRLSDAAFEATLARIHELVDQSGVEVPASGPAAGQPLARHTVRAHLHRGGAGGTRSSPTTTGRIP